jgi:molybdopterin synthase catalytic subunit
MSVAVHILPGPLGAPVAWTPPPGHGALLCFEGVARPNEQGRAILALHYEAYEPMASIQLAEIARQIVAQFGLMGLCVEHSVGRVDAGRCSFRLRVASPHRKEALAAMDLFIDRLKRDVPIWKTAVPS